MNVKQRDNAFLARAEGAEELQVVRSRGSVLFDANGKKYIDFVMGWCVGNLGWSNRAIRSAITEHESPDYVYPYFRYRRWGELAEMLAEIAPGKLKRCFRATGGSEAVDIALQIAQTATGREKFVSVEGAYHGNTTATAGIGEKASKANTIAPPLDAKAADKVETRLKKGDVAAFIVEAIRCSNVMIPERDFFDRVARICKRYGTLLIVDEVASGFGRTGRMFASEHFELQPDVMCMAKGITAGYAPMGATITTEKVARAIKGENEFSSTYGWHPLAVEAAIATIGIMREPSFLEHVNSMSDYFRARLTKMDIGDVRVKGLAIAVETKRADEIQRKCGKAGLIIATDEDLLTLFPALTIDRAAAKKGLDILADCAA